MPHRDNAGIMRCGGLLHRTFVPFGSTPPRPTTGSPPRRRGSRPWWGLVLAALLLAAALSPQPTGAQEKIPLSDAAIVPQTIDFDGGVRLALRQSPFFAKSSLEIEVRRLDEKDSKSDFFPTFNFRARYFLVQPSGVHADPLRYALELNTDAYNPLEAYFSLRARQVITQIATLAHHKVVSEGLSRLGRGFLELEALQRVTILQGEVISLARQNLKYQQKRLQSGTASQLEVQIATQELQLAQGERDRLLASQVKLREGMKSFLGLKPGQPLTFELRQVRSQTLGSFQPATVSLEQARARSFELKMELLKRELQTWNITLAKMKLMPGLFMGVQTPDPLALSDVRGAFFSVGITWQIFDGFKKARNITRQKTILKQVDSEIGIKESDFQDRWLAAQERWRSAAAESQLARSQEELARLKERQADIRYQAGSEPFATLVEGRKTFLKAQINTRLKALEADLAVLGLRHLSGDLLYHYLVESSWPK